MNKIKQIKKQTYGTVPFSFSRRMKSISYAAAGVVSFLKAEHNAWIHLAATILVIVFGFVYHVSKMETMMLALSVGFVWATELFNTAIERTMDMISAEKNPSIKIIKDLSAAAVLIAAITAVVIGCIIFIPKF
jgi:diacylglycerol kinase (ATP)